MTGPVSAASQAAYRRRVSEDKRRVLAKFSEVLAADGSWAMCSQCARTQHRPLLAMDIPGKKGPSHATQKCSRCWAGVGYATVSLDTIREVLRGLPEKVLWAALWPLEPDVDLPVFARYGYWVHTDMIRFWRRPTLVTDQVDLLEYASHRARAKEACVYLLGPSESVYGRFVAMQRCFLAQHRTFLSERPSRVSVPWTLVTKRRRLPNLWRKFLILP